MRLRASPSPPPDPRVGLHPRLSRSSPGWDSPYQSGRPKGSENTRSRRGTRVRAWVRARRVGGGLGDSYRPRKQLCGSPVPSPEDANSRGRGVSKRTHPGRPCHLGSFSHYSGDGTTWEPPKSGQGRESGMGMGGKALG